LKATNQVATRLTLMLAVCLLTNAAIQGQQSAAAILTSPEIETVRKGATGDVQMLVADAGGYNIGLATMKRTYTGKPESAIVHAKVTEIYYITDGSGTLLLGGTVKDAQALPPDNNVVRVLAGPTTMGGTVQNAELRRVGKGDFVVIPAGVQHSFSSIDGSIEYLMVRVDSDKVLPAGLVNDLIKQVRGR